MFHRSRFGALMVLLGVLLAILRVVLSTSSAIRISTLVYFTVIGFRAGIAITIANNTQAVTSC